MNDHDLLIIGISLVNFIALTLCTVWGTLLLNLPLQPWDVLISLLICSIILWWTQSRKPFTKYTGGKNSCKYVMAAVLALLITSLLLAGAFHDFSYDGQNYQQEALIQLHQGWNPLWNPALSTDIPYSLWINSYPKALWYFSTAIYQFTGFIETGKLFQELLLLSTLFITHSALRFLLKSNVLCWLISLLLVANPVTIVQFFTFYVDGVLYLSFLALIALGYIRYFLVRQKSDCSMLDTGIAATIIVLSNIKFTGIIYAGLFCTAWIFFTLFSTQRKAVVKLCTISLITSCLLIGYHPYITNLIHHGHPFWPLLGENSVDIMTPNEHPDFLKQNRLTKIIWSNMATGRNNADFNPAPLPEPRGTPELKIPFTFSQYELKLYESADTRIGGFGPWFGGILICSVLLGGFLALHPRTAARNHFVILLTGLSISILINPEAWWARYTPQLWMLPLIILIYACYITELQTNPKLKYLTALFLFLFIINSALVLFLSVRAQVRSEYQLHRQLEIINEYTAKNPRRILIDFSTFQANRKFFQEKGIPYIAVDGEKGQLDIPFIQLAGSRTKIYIPDQRLINKLTNNDAP